MRLEIPRIYEHLAAVLTVEGFVEVIAESFLAQFLCADATDKVLRVTLKINAYMHFKRVFRLEDCVAVFASWFACELADLMLLHLLARLGYIIVV